LAILSEHSFGVRCVALSADARWLASVGDIYDGFIFVWALGTRIASPRLQGSNKCITTVNAMTWMGKSIVTVGVRHVKVWRPDLSNAPSPVKSKFKSDLKDSVPSSPSSKAINGRNCILGSLIESDFTCVADISDAMAIIGTNNGDICLLDDRSGNQTLTAIRKESYAIASISADRDNREVWIGGARGHIRCVSFAELEAAPSPKTLDASVMDSTISTKDLADQANIIALGLFKHCLVTIDSTRCLRLLPRTVSSSRRPPLKEFPSHQRPVLGTLLASSVDSLDRCFMSYDAAGEVILWDHEGNFQATYGIPLEQLPYEEGIEVNELTVIKPSVSGRFVVAGDKYGILR
jgi:WD40 repeat protein